MDLQVIHVVLGKANPNRMNGVNKVVNSLATFQTKLGSNVSLWGITKNLTVNYPQRNYTTVLFQDCGKFKLDPKLKKQIDQTPKNTVFHIHGGFIPQFYLIAKRLKARGLKYVFTPHGAYNTIAMQRSAWRKKLYCTLFEKQVVRHAKYLHFIGKSEVEGAEKVFGKTPFALIPNGQDMDVKRSIKGMRTKRAEPIFGFVGRLDVHTKGLDILLQGFAKHLETSKLKSVLWIIGDGAEKNQLVELAQALEIESQVKFWGGRFGEEKISLMEQMDYLCLTSRNEGLPGVVLEAAALGVPSIVSPETNMTTYLLEHQAGFCLPENTVEALHNELDFAGHWLKDPIFTAELRQNNLQMIAETFNWNTIAHRLIEVYAA